MFSLNGSHFTNSSIPKRLPSKKYFRIHKLPNGSRFSSTSYRLRTVTKGVWLKMCSSYFLSLSTLWEFWAPPQFHVICHCHVPNLFSYQYPSWILPSLHHFFISSSQVILLDENPCHWQPRQTPVVFFLLVHILLCALC